MVSNWYIILLILFCINATLELDFAFRFYNENGIKTEIDKVSFAVFISSAIWTIGAGLFSCQTNYIAAYVFRIIGCIGVFAFIISLQNILCVLSELSPKAKKYLHILSGFGIIILPLFVFPGNTIYHISSIGMTFYLKRSIFTIIGIVYLSLMAASMLFISVHILKFHRLNRLRYYAKWFVVIDFCVFAGSFGDMLLPVLQIPAVPGSSISHFLATFVFWFAIHGIFKSKVTISNISEYIYYSLEIPVLVFDSNLKLAIMNDASASFFNRTSSDISNEELTISSLFRTSNDIMEFPDGNKTFRCRCITNNAHCEITISKIIDSFQDTIGYIAVIHDLTEHELAIRKLEQAKLASDSANMTKSLFLANMSHEIRTPMNAILGFSEIALSGNVDKKSKEYFSDIKQAGETLLSIINDILSISKIELGQQELNLADYEPLKVFKDVKLIIDMQASKKGLSFTMNVDQSCPKVLYGDKDKIRQILINLCNNSVKYTNAGSLNLKIAVLSQDADTVTLQFTVSDTGIGIKPEDIGSIFEKFKRVDEKLNSATEGTGLGLPITKSVVELMGGTISVESVYGTGSIFTVVLPQKVVDTKASIADSDASTATGEAEKAPIDTNYRVLAVDDNKVNLKVVSALLKRFNISFDTASSGADAINLCENNQYKLIFMDQMMPKMDGVEAMQRIRRLPGYDENSDTKIVALTANVVEGAKEDLLGKGFDDFLGKPVSLIKFEDVLKKFL